MTGMDRRSAIARLGVLALVTTYGGRAPSAFAGEPVLFKPPGGVALLERRVVRGLSDGAAITVSRRWEVSFTPLGRGFRMQGKQIGVEVDAPEKLAALAKVESERVEAGFLPLSLSADGLIVESPERTSAESVEKAALLASQMISASRLSNGERDSAKAFLRQLHSNVRQSISQLPRDLFLPQQLSYSEVQSFAVPGGGEGELSIAFEADLAPSRQCLARAERSVSTSLGDILQRSSESWVLAAA